MAKEYEVMSQEDVGLSDGPGLGLSGHSDNPTPLILDYPMDSLVMTIFLGGV